MFVCAGLKGNRFKEVAIPKKSEYFARLNGQLREPTSQYFSGDSEVPISGMSKVDELDLANRANMNAIRREAAEAAEAARKGDVE